VSEKTEKEWEDEAEQLKLMHILKLGGTDKHGICLAKCDDEACNVGCLQQQAKIFRPQIMQGVRIYRERNWHKYPLYAESAFQTGKPCTREGMHIVCKETVCGVVGCMERPAWQFRDLILLALREEKNYK
jgi:hypothetical protein